jgi:hypothetical protein
LGLKKEVVASYHLGVNGARSAVPTPRTPREHVERRQPFRGLREAKTFNSGSFLDNGRYRLKIQKCIYKKLNAGGNAFIVEATVLESTNEKHPVGAQRSWFQKENESFQSAVKLFCYAATGFDEKNAVHEKRIKTEVEPNCETIMLKAITEDLLKGREVFVDVTSKPKKKTEGDFSLHTFSPAQPPMGDKA